VVRGHTQPGCTRRRIAEWWVRVLVLLLLCWRLVAIASNAEDLCSGFMNASAGIKAVLRWTSANNLYRACNSGIKSIMRVGIAGDRADQKKLVGLASFQVSPTSFYSHRVQGRYGVPSTFFIGPRAILRGVQAACRKVRGAGIPLRHLTAGRRFRRLVVGLQVPPLRLQRYRRDRSSCWQWPLRTVGASHLPVGAHRCWNATD
jgi:hypothetical protein